MDKYAALLVSPWVYNKNTKTIEGHWAEDSSIYNIECPIQLSDLLIDLQNKLYNQYDKILATKAALNRLQNTVQFLSED